MATKKFSGNSNYELQGVPKVTGRSVSIPVDVERLEGYGYYKLPPGTAYSGTVDGTAVSGTFLYDFRNGVKLQRVVTLTKSNMTPGTKSWSITVSMSSGIGSATISGTFVVAPDAPSAPTIGTPVRNSDTSISAFWDRNASVAAPYDSQQVQRSTFDGSWSDYVTIATISTKYTTSGGQSRADTKTTANRSYRYRVRASNAKGSATSAVAQTVYTTPGTPSAVKATKTAAGGIALVVTQTVPWNAQTQIERSTDGGSSWSSLVTLAPGTNSYTFSSPTAGETYVFRARAVNQAGLIGAGLASGWRTSNSVPLAAPPAAPSKLTPNGAAFDGDTAQTFRWQHNTLDSSDQSAYAIEWREQGSGAWSNVTGKVASETSSRVFPAGTFENGKTYEWHVRTWGVHESAGPYSATATFTASAPPSVTITSPGEIVAASIAAVAWEYFDEESSAQSAWQASLLAGGNELEALSGQGAATSVTFATRLTDDTEYQVRVRVRDGASLWSEWDTVTFTTDFPLPPVPVVQLSWDAEQGAVVAEITNPDPGVGQVPAIANDLYWSVDGSEWTLAFSGAMLNTSTADLTAPVGVPVSYKAVAWSDLPSSAESAVVSIETPADIGYWSVGDGLSVAMEYGNGDGPRVDFTSGLYEKTLHYFAGRTLPIEVAGTARSRVGAVTFMITTREQLNAVRAMQYLPAPHLIRIPDGTLLFCSISEVSERRIHDDLYGIGFTATEVTR